MSKKRILFVANTVECAKLFADVLQNFDCVLMTSRLDSVFSNINEYKGSDLAIIELPEEGLSEEIRAKVKLSNFGIENALIVCPDTLVDSLRLPVHINCDFVMKNASEPEVIARVKHLLYPGWEANRNDLVFCGNMTIDIGTYQVKVNDVPLDLTYLEYALLSFLVTHPNHSYSRNELLKRVWGFDYLGGSRTVDVHIRRIRAKIGPENANRLETVRGVGYLWNL